MLQEVSSSFLTSMEGLWIELLSFIPVFFGALLVLVLGLFISSTLGKLAKKLVSFTKVDELAEKIGLKREVEGIGLKLNFSLLISFLVKWFFYIATFIAVVDILNIKQLSSFLERIVFYLPNVIIAVVILTVGLIFGKIIKDAIDKSLKKMSATEKSSAFLSSLAKWAIFIFAFMAALVQLGVASNLIQILFTSFVFMLALAGGLAFGLGGRDHAKKVLDWIERETSSNK